VIEFSTAYSLKPPDISMNAPPSWYTEAAAELETVFDSIFKVGGSSVRVVIVASSKSDSGMAATRLIWSKVD